MGRININTLVAAIAVTALIVGPIMHFINPNVAKAVVSVQQQKQKGTFFPSTSTSRKIQCYGSFSGWKSQDDK